MNLLVWIVPGIIILLLLFLARSAIRVVQQYERGVIFVLGRLIGAKGPGLFLVPPFISRMSKVDLRIVTLTVPPQEVITRDNVTIKVTAVLYFYVLSLAKEALQMLLVRRRLLGASGNGRTTRKNQLIEVKQ
jgi:regulator of protease activity HflC (stomatin/prohibitin superfamily)